MRLYNLLTDDQAYELYAFLEGEQGCNFRTEDGKTVWNCDNTHSKTDIWLDKNNLTFESIYWAREHFCDCEIVLNFPFDFDENE